MEDTNLLLVDDDVDWGETTAALLEHERESLDVRYVSDADEAVEEFEEGFDCVLADYNMPGVDGIDLLEIVRDDYPDLPYILITSQGSEDVASEAVSKGVTDYIVKRPGDDQTDTIVNRVENAVRSYRA
ncbi:MAG: response regulator, partial [Halobacteria archaeon]|nr:response regulator [Halobacteria archaeon]